MYIYSYADFVSVKQLYKSKAYTVCLLNNNSILTNGFVFTTNIQNVIENETTVS